MILPLYDPGVVPSGSGVPSKIDCETFRQTRTAVGRGVLVLGTLVLVGMSVSVGTSVSVGLGVNVKVGVKEGRT